MVIYSALSDNELSQLLQQLDRAAYTEIYNRYWMLLFRHGRKMLQDDEEALDVVQEVFTMLWAKATEMPINTSLSSFLYTAVRNDILNLMRRGKVKEKYMVSLGNFLDNGSYVTDEQIRYKEFAATIEQEIAKLPPKMKQIFEMSRNLGLSYSQIAQEMDISDETVRKQMHRALKKLRVSLGPHLYSLIFIL